MLANGCQHLALSHGKIQALGRWVFLDQEYPRILEEAPYPQEAQTLFCLW